MPRPRARLIAGALAGCLAAPVASAQSIPSAAPDAAGLPALASSVPAEAGDVPGVSLAYEQPKAAPAPAPPAAASGFRAWGQYVFTTSRLGADGNGPAVRSSSDGLSVGIERAIDPTLVLGASLGYGLGRGTSPGVRSDTESFAGAAYAWWNPAGGLEIDALLGGNGLSADTRRLVTIGGAPAALSGTVSGLGFSGLAAAGYRFRPEGSPVPSFVKPFVSLAYASQDRPGYAESSGAGGLYFPGRSFERAAVNLGVAAGTDIPFLWGLTLRPEASVSWSRLLVDPSPAVPVLDVATGRGTVLRDPRPGQDGLLVAGELALWDAPGIQGFVGYTGEFRGNATIHQARVGLRSFW